MAGEIHPLKHMVPIIEIRSSMVAIILHAIDGAYDLLSQEFKTLDSIGCTDDLYNDYIRTLTELEQCQHVLNSLLKENKNAKTT